MSTAAPHEQSQQPPQPGKASQQQPAQSGGGYHVPRPHGVCAVSGRKIEAGEKLFTAIRETPEGIERIDVAPEAWETYDRSNVLAFWQTIMPEHEVKKKVFVDDEVLCTLFERLADATEPVKVNFRFVLGLILMRKRLIVYEDAKHVDGKDVWVVRMKGREERLNLIDPKLDEQQVTDVSAQLGEILNQEM
jgi:hypothetical protein